jgi:hypothetical protein
MCEEDGIEFGMMSEVTIKTRGSGRRKRDFGIRIERAIQSSSRVVLNSK